MLQKTAAFVLTLSLVILAGCNTMAGFGKDVSKVGDKIEQKADQHK
ncbi:MAG: entericidin A/B family lipoprotein [Burkholderiales bacterium]